jgi:hypothetical protein
MSKSKALKQKNEEPKEQEEIIEEAPAPKVKKQLTQEQLDNLAKAREKAKERKIELAQIASKAKLLKEEQLKKAASEYDKFISEKAASQKENQPPPKEEPPKKQEIEPKKKRIVKKYVYEDEDEEVEEVEEVVIRKPKPKTKQEPSYNELIYESAQDRIKSKISEERTKSLISSLMPVHFR